MRLKRWKKGMDRWRWSSRSRSRREAGGRREEKKKKRRKRRKGERERELRIESGWSCGGRRKRKGFFVVVYSFHLLCTDGAWIVID